MSNEVKQLTFSPAQQKALDLTRQNLLVSAGAGSGKTAVLVQRLYDILTIKNVGLDRILCLTFTVAGAEEFKKRIKTKLSSNPLHASKAYAVDSADITTFDAYALKLLKKYGYLLDFDSNVTNMSSSVEQILLRRSFDKVMVKYYENPPQVLTDFAKRFLDKDDEFLFALVLDLHQKVNLDLNREDFINHFIDKYYAPEMFESHLQKLNSYVVSVLSQIVSLSKTLSDDKHAKKYDSFIDHYKTTLTYEAFLIDPTFEKKPNAPSKSTENYPEDGPINNKLKVCFQKLRDIRNFGSSNQMYQNFILDKRFASFILEIYKQAIVEVDTFKAEQNTYTFADVARNAYQLLKFDSVAEELKHQYEYILIDEYQDTSDLQEAFTSMFADDNVYMVGDIKQSIYGFRNSNCDIFCDKYAKYRHSDGGKLVVLNDNYRSRYQVLDAINAILNELMSTKIGGADYQREHQINYGNKGYDTLFGPNQIYGLQALEYDEESLIIDTASNLQLEKPRKHEKIVYEANLVVNIIKQKIAENYQVYDADKKAMRSVTYKDFAILCSRAYHFPTIEMIFRNNNVPLFVNRDEDVTNHQLIIAINSMLKLFYMYTIDPNPSNYEFRFNAASFLRSFIIHYSDQQLFDLFKDGNRDFSKDPVLSKLKQLAITYLNRPIDEILKALMNSFDVYASLYTIGDLNENIIRLTKRIDEINGLGKLGFSLAEIIALFQDGTKDEQEIKMSRPQLVEDAVNLMTIHHSKGLEYPIVFLIDLGSNFYSQNNRNKSKTNANFGLVLPLANSGISFNGFLMNRQENMATLSEKIRLLYVALTRARELIYTIQPQAEEDKIPTLVEDAASLSDLLQLSSYYQKHKVISDYRIPSISEGANIDFVESNQKIEIRKFNYSFTSVKVDNEPLSVTSVNETLLNKGTLLHKYIELFDFKTQKLEYIPDTEDRYHIKKLLSLPLFQSANSDNVYREYQFIDEITNKTYIIDFFILGSREIILIDFKLFNLDKENYQKQVNNYASYLKKVFHKPVKAYLVSIINLEVKEVSIHE